MIRVQVGDLSSHSTKYSSPALTQKVFANMRRVGKGFFGVDTPLFEGMIVAQHDDDVADEGQDSSISGYHKVKTKVTTAKLITEVVTVASATITGATTPLTATAITTAPSAARRRKGVVIRDPKETATPSNIIHSEPKSKDTGKGIMVEEPKPLKKQAQITQDEAYAREEQMEEEDNKALKRSGESQAEKAAKKQKLDEEVEELKKHL
nr:hypothetical protein [Tanacetum cinerariifolium]